MQWIGGGTVGRALPSITPYYIDGASEKGPRRWIEARKGDRMLLLLLPPLILPLLILGLLLPCPILPCSSPCLPTTSFLHFNCPYHLNYSVQQPPLCLWDLQAFAPAAPKGTCFTMLQKYLWRWTGSSATVNSIWDWAISQIN